MSLSFSSSPPLGIDPSYNRPNLFHVPKQNDFQWHNLYLKQFGSCTYAPPIPKNASTTTADFPMRRVMNSEFGYLRDDDDFVKSESSLGDRSFLTADSSVLALRSSHNKRRKMLLDYNTEGNNAANAADSAAYSLAQASEDGCSCQGEGLTSATAVPHRKTYCTSCYSKTSSISHTSSFLKELLEGDDAKDELDFSFFDFLRRPCNSRQDEAMPFYDNNAFFPPSESSVPSDSCHTAPQWQITRTSTSESAVDMTSRNGNLLPRLERSSILSPYGGSSQRGEQFVKFTQPCNTPPEKSIMQRSENEILSMQRETWRLLMDNRAVAWLEREAQESSKAASHMRRRLLEIVAGPMTFSSKYIGAFEDFNRPDAKTILSSEREYTTISDEVAMQRVYESFLPFFAVISSPSLLCYMREQFDAALRAQVRGQTGRLADLVGMPLFSQYATWKEAYQHRKAWSNAPFSYFLIHDASFNYAHICALFVLLQAVRDAAHEHTEHCLNVANAMVHIEDMNNMLVNSKSIRMAVENNLNLCPLLAIQQTTEDLLLAFEQSSTRDTLSMTLYVCSFLTDCSLNMETAAQFLSVDALQRYSHFQVPVAPPETASAEPPQSTPVATHPNSPGSPLNGGDLRSGKQHASDKDAAAGKGGEAERASEAGDKSTSQNSAHPLERRFSVSDFESLFDLVFWFTDAVTAHSNLPIDPELLAGPRTGRGGDANVATDTLPTRRYSKQSALSASQRSDRQDNSKELVGLGMDGALTPKIPQRAKWQTTNAKSKGMSISWINKRPNSLTRTKSFSSGAVDSSSAMLDEKEVPMEATQYIPGRYYQYHAVSSLMEAITKYEICRQALLLRRKQQQYENEKNDEVKTKGLFQQRSSSAVGGRRRRMRRSTAHIVAASPSSLPSFDLSASTTFLATPLIFVTTYIRLHGSSWLKQLFERLFNILRKESVLLYVNTLDLPSSFNYSSESTSFTSPLPPLVNEQVRTDTPLGVDPNTAAAGVNQSNESNSELPQVFLSSLSTTNVLLNPAPAADFDRRLKRLEDLICQDILYVMNEFFSALYGIRSTTRLPQGITSLITQFTSSVHLHLLQTVASLGGHDVSGGRNMNSGPLPSGMNTDDPRATVRRVNECLHSLKNTQIMSGKSNIHTTANVSLSAVKRLINSVEQYRLAKFILFDSWIISTLNNVVSYGFLNDRFSKHLRWNIDAFARYLKILVNSPFMDEDVRRQYATAGLSEYLNTTTKREINLSPAVITAPPKKRGKAPLARTISNAGLRKMTGGSSTSVPESSATISVEKAQKPPLPPPVTMPLPRFITGVYDVASGNLVRLCSTVPLNHEGSERGFLMSNNSLHSESTLNMIPRSTDPLASKALLRHQIPVAPSSSSLNSLLLQPEAATAVPRLISFKGAGALGGSFRNVHNVIPRHQSTAIPRPPVMPTMDTQLLETPIRLFTVMEGSAWEPISSSMKGLNEALGIVGYDAEEEEFDKDFMTHSSAPRAHRQSEHLQMAGEGGPSSSGLAQRHCAMRLLNYFCRRACQEGGTSVVVTEFKVPPTMAASCIDKLHYLVTGQHPLVENAMARGLLPSNFAFSPYLACLHGTLLHPKSAIQALDNIYYNNQTFYHTLMRPLEDETMLQLVMALTADRKGLPMVDTNAVLPLVNTHTSTLQVPSSATSATRAPSSLLARRWKLEARKLDQQQVFLTSGATARMPRIEGILRNVSPVSPMHFLQAGEKLIFNEAHVVPLCFEPWWRAMVLSLCVKVTTLLSECSLKQSDTFSAWCQSSVVAANRLNRQNCTNFIRNRGKSIVIHNGATGEKGEETKDTDRSQKVGRTKMSHKTGSSANRISNKLQATLRSKKKSRPEYSNMVQK